MFNKVRDKIKSISDTVKDKTKKAKSKIAAIGISSMVAMSMAISASAEGETAVTGSTASLSGAVTDILDVVTQIFNYILGNWYLLLFFAGGLILLAIRMFKAIKRSAKG